ncbi:hypothetical protein FVF72_07960 [Methanothermobacter sp. KEPCO-1]|nr:hypothetical protein FVF72_07960 [Methanothermobacter sp. KEPCO-1]
MKQYISKVEGILLDYESWYKRAYPLICIVMFLCILALKYHCVVLSLIAAPLGLFTLLLLCWLYYELKEKEYEIRWMMVMLLIVGLIASPGV